MKLYTNFQKKKREEIRIVRYDFRQVVAWHRPFCVDLQEGTFALLRSFLEGYCQGFDSPNPPPPFPTAR